MDEGLPSNPSHYQQKSASTTYMPITLHIVGNDDSTGYANLSAVLASFCQVNEDYRPTGIQFYIEFPIRYIENSAFNNHDSVRTGGGFMLQYNVPNTTNCYIVGDPAGACGYNVMYGGLTVSQNCLSGNTFSHELGHALGVQHPFLGWEGGQGYNGSPQQAFNGPAPERLLLDYTVFRDTMWGPDTIIVDTVLVEYVTRTGPNANCQTAADGFCDTPADYLAFRWNCGANNTGGPQQLDPDTVAFYSVGDNIMSYSTCRSSFSVEQGQYMNAFIQNNRTAHLYNQNPIKDSIADASQMQLIEPLTNATLPSNAPITFRWNRVAGATHYLLKICYTPCATNAQTVEEVLLTDTSYVSNMNYTPRPSFLPYRWQVLPFNQSYSCAGQTPTRPFNTQLVSALRPIKEVSLFEVFPNPVASGASLQITIESDTDLAAQLQLYSLTGQLLQQQSIPLQAGKQQLDFATEGLAAGVYLLQLERNGQRWVRKVVIME